MSSASSQVKEAEVSIVIIRANGTVEDLGVVARYSSNPIKQAMNQLNGWIKTRTKSFSKRNGCDSAE